MKNKQILSLLALSAVIGCTAAESPKSEARSELDPKLGVESPERLSTLTLREQNDHPVTAEMKNAAAEMSQRKAPDFSLNSTKGETLSLAQLTDKRPLLIFFVELSCPCCVGAKHFVDRMADAYRDELNVVGIINAETEFSDAWVRVTEPKFRVLEDPEQKVIRAYAAERGVYTTLIDQNGMIVKSYPGYNIDMLKDLSQRVAKLAGVEYKPIISAAAPKKLTSGCLFPEPKKS